MTPSDPTAVPHFAARARASDGRPSARRLAGLSGAPSSAPTPRPSRSAATAVVLAPTAVDPEPSAPVQPPAPETVAPVEQAQTAPPAPWASAEAAAAPALTTTSGEVDYAVVRALRAKVTEELRADLKPGTPLDHHSHRERIQHLIQEQVRDYGAHRLDEGLAVLDAAGVEALTRALEHALFGIGRIQPLLDEPGVENIEVEGYDNVWLQFAGGRVERRGPVAESDAELLEDIAHLARTCPYGEKDFSPATKHLRMTLPDGSRLAAEAWMTSRPSITIRKHRFVDTDLTESVRLGAVSASLAQFLAAVIRAGRSVIISGLPASGKTTLARAIANALDPHVRIATIESQYELLLHQMPQRHYRVWAAEAQEGGEVDARGHAAGAYTLTDLVEKALQKNVQRLIVGEVVGDEVAAMLSAMQSCQGGMATVHARSATDTVHRLASLTTAARANLTYEDAARMVASYVDVVVHVATVDEVPIGGAFHRFVDEVVILEPGSEPGVPVQQTAIYAPGPDGRAIPTGEKPPWLMELVRTSFDPAWLTPAAGTWEQPLELQQPIVAPTMAGGEVA